MRFSQQLVFSRRNKIRENRFSFLLSKSAPTELSSRLTKKVVWHLGGYAKPQPDWQVGSRKISFFNEKSIYSKKKSVFSTKKSLFRRKNLLFRRTNHGFRSFTFETRRRDAALGKVFPHQIIRVFVCVSTNFGSMSLDFRYPIVQSGWGFASPPKCQTKKIWSPRRELCRSRF